MYAIILIPNIMIKCTGENSVCSAYSKKNRIKGIGTTKFNTVIQNFMISPIRVKKD